MQQSEGELFASSGNWSRPAWEARHWLVAAGPSEPLAPGFHQPSSSRLRSDDA